ncbi:hypothetical protein E2C01_049606 [Portunus trituberculatus]|uniref:Uncharacterized protein n=1 Tax=Portunus trituberculatus TaxID=210409 RepID=A0A5B7GGH9_PORTR|nr:hypothetical protein [Portunus trituberculatus]
MIRKVKALWGTTRYESIRTQLSVDGETGRQNTQSSRDETECVARVSLLEPLLGVSWRMFGASHTGQGFRPRDQHVRGYISGSLAR